MSRKEIKPLTGIRGVAALAVLYHHFGEKMEVITPGLSWLSTVREHGNLGVELFFILSGFIMTYVYSQHKRAFGVADYRDFMVKRFARIYPNHITILILMLAVWLAANLAGVRMDGKYDWVNYLTQVFMLNGYYPGKFSDWNYPNWSVSIEWFGYFAVFPLSIAISRLKWLKEHPLISCFGILAIPMLGSPVIHPGIWTTVLITCTFLSGFFTFIAWEKYNQIKVGKIALGDLVAVSIAVVLCLASKFPISDYWVKFLLVISFPLLLLGLASLQGGVARVLSSKGAVYLGTVSYALYISHALVEKVLKVVAPTGKCALMSAPVRGLIVVGHILLPIVVASALYHLVEKPARKWLCGVLLKRKQPRSGEGAGEARKPHLT